MHRTRLLSCSTYTSSILCTGPLLARRGQAGVNLTHSAHHSQRCVTTHKYASLFLPRNICTLPGSVGPLKPYLGRKLTYPAFAHCLGGIFLRPLPFPCSKMVFPLRTHTSSVSAQHHNWRASVSYDFLTCYFLDSFSTYCPSANHVAFTEVTSYVVSSITYLLPAEWLAVVNSAWVHLH